MSESEIRYVINIAEQRKKDACARAPSHDQKSDLEDRRRVLKGSAPRVSRRVKCAVDHGRDRLASLAILSRRLRLCGQPFAASAEASWQ